MPPHEQSSIEFFFDEFQILSQEASVYEPGEEREAWMVWGYEKSLMRDEAQVWLASQSQRVMDELAMLAEELDVAIPVPNLTRRCQKLLFLGAGFFFGLRQSRQISGFAWLDLRDRLHRWLRTEQQDFALVRTLLDRSIPHHHKLILRQRAYLIQRLREEGFPEWITLRELLFWYDDSVTEELLQWVSRVRSFLNTNDLQQLRAIGQGSLLEPHAK
ncbi:MAG: hypothetical protein EP343_28135 [Deltaproteobacteria bacterium]|nr:MAG: hypothetical protein EP343_28135 [Deltaproteobacteria bacterium]